MDVKVMAFEIFPGSGVLLPALYNHIIQTADRAVDKRLLYINQADGWWRGLIIASKDIKAFSRLIRERGAVLLSPEAIHDGELAHFNFFIINAHSGKGYYQYYHGSSSVNTFFYSLQRKNNELKEILMDAACREAGIERHKMPSHLKQRFTGKLKCNLVLRRKSFAEMMEEIRYVKNLSIQFTEYIPDQPLFRPLAEQAKSIKHQLVFGIRDDATLLQNIISLAQSDVLKDLRGIGVTDDHFERHFRLLNEPETLAHFDFNDVVLEAQFDSRDIAQSMNDAPMITKLMEIAQADRWASG